MSRQVQLVILCEDRQHETFVRRFLKESGWPTRRLRVERSSKGKGSAEQFVRERFPIELEAYRSNRNRVAQGLIVVRDGDNNGVTARIQELSAACVAKGIEPRKDDEAVAILIPTWNIETWLTYLGGSNVDETNSSYPKFERQRDCQAHVEKLREMCRSGAFAESRTCVVDGRLRGVSASWGFLTDDETDTEFRPTEKLVRQYALKRSSHPTDLMPRGTQRFPNKSRRCLRAETRRVPIMRPVVPSPRAELGIVADA